MEFQSSNSPRDENFQEWTIDNDKLFKDALVMFDENTPDRWAKIAAVLPTKKFFHVLQYYKELEEKLLERVLISPHPESSTSTEMEIIPLLEAQLQSERENLAMLEAQLQHEREHIAMLETQLQLERERNQMPALVQSVNNFHVQPLVSWNPHATVQVQPPPALQAQPSLVAQAQQPPIQPNNVDIKSRIHEAVHMAISQNQGSFQVVPTINHNYDGSGKRPTSSENERKKRIHWTDEEHMSFLLGLQKCGPGKWRDISRKFVCTKSPTQVASHAQKYHNRQILSKDNKRRRTSIHDMVINPDIQETTTTTTPYDEDKAHISFQQSQMPSLQQNQTSIQEVQPEWMNYISYDLYNNESFMVSDPNCDDMFMSCSKDHEVAAAQDLYGYAFPQTFGEPHSQDFNMASSSSDFHNDSIYNIPPM